MLKNVGNIQPVPNRMHKVNGWSCTSWLWHPRQLACDCLSNSCRPVVLKPFLKAAFGSQAPVQRPQQSFNKTSKILCNRLHFYYKTKRVNWIALKNFTEAFQQSNHVGLDLVPFSEKVENHWYRLWKGTATAHTLVGVQHQRWTFVI